MLARHSSHKMLIQINHQSLLNFLSEREDFASGERLARQADADLIIWATLQNFGGTPTMD